MVENIEIGGKEKMLLDWVEVRNAMLRADSGEMKISYQKQTAESAGIIGMTVELSLQFDKELPPDFSDDERSFIEAAQKKGIEEVK
jgi:hypothetical protein